MSSRPTGRNGTLVRVLGLLRLLEGRRRHTLDELADGFNVSTRTMRRDLQALQDVGYAIGHEERADGSARGEVDRWRGEWWLL